MYRFESNIFDLTIDHYLLHWIYENYGYVVDYSNTYLGFIVIFGDEGVCLNF